ncbi:MAG: hypothetical protein L0332_06850 [Chloroflexi bacterium]|nr:hypothetical protein [Chloroflexota bacterium]
MSSTLVAIHDGLANAAVTVDSQVVPAHKLDEVKNAYERADLPRRLILPPGAAGGGALEFDFQTFGANGAALITWRVTDLMLWQAQAQGRGVGPVFSKLTAYIGAYADMLRALKFPTDTSQIVGFDPQAGIYEWPPDSGNTYFGVQCLVLVTERLC